MNPEQIFLVVHYEHLLSVLIAGALFGYLFASRISAHLSPPEYGFRTLFTGLVFLGGMTATFALGGATWWEAWIGVMVGWVVYTAGIVVGLMVWDRRLRRVIEAEMGRPLKGGHRFIRPKKR